MEKQHIIRWTREEQALYIERLAEVLTAHPGESCLRQLEIAQDILDLPRRKSSPESIRNSSVDYYEAAMRLLRSKDNGHHAESSGAEQSPATEQETLYVPVPCPLLLSDVPTHELIAEAVLRLINLLRPITPPALESSPPSPVPDQRPTASAQNNVSPVIAARIPRVGILGLLRDQFAALKNRVNGKKLELVWIDKDRAAAPIASSLDHVLVQRHSSHKHFERARAAIGSDRVTFVSGGISACALALAERYPGCLN